MKISEDLLRDLMLASPRLNPQALLSLYNIEPYEILYVFDNAPESVKRAVDEAYPDLDPAENLLYGILHGLLYTPFIYRIVKEEKMKTGKYPLIVSVGRDAIPFVVVTGEIRKQTGMRPGIGFIGISSAHKELHDIFSQILTSLVRREKPQIPTPLPRSVAKVVKAIKRYDQVREKYGLGSIVLADVGIKGTHNVPAKVVAESHGIHNVKTALFQVQGSYVPLVDYKHVVLIEGFPSEIDKWATAFTEATPKLTHPFGDMNVPAEPGIPRSPKDWKFYEMGLRLGTRHVLRELR
ncbi:MAG: hypothetical protein GXO00_00275 [Candidatus Diapherotrites archaeon]|nr:hypothetical protein [Candidatus Diapherotrites archaeon]